MVLFKPLSPFFPVFWVECGGDFHNLLLADRLLNYVVSMCIMGIFDFLKGKREENKVSFPVTEYKKLIVAAKTPEEIEKIMTSEPPFVNKPDELGEHINQFMSDVKSEVYNAQSAKNQEERVRDYFLHLPFSIELSKREVLAHLGVQEITKFGMYRPLLEGVHQDKDIAFIFDLRAKESKIYTVNERSSTSEGRVYVQKIEVEGPRNMPHISVGERKSQHFANANEAVADYLSKYAINAIVVEADLEFKIEKIKKYFLDQYGVFVHSERPLRVIKERSSL